MPTFDSMKAAASGMGVTLAQLRAAKNGGAPGFRSNRIYSDEVLPWIQEHGADIEEAEESLKEQKIREEVRKLRIANELKEGRLVPRPWVAERIHRAGGELQAARAKSEAEHPLLFSSAGGDVASCRTILRGIWADIFAKIGALAAHLEEPPADSRPAQPAVAKREPKPKSKSRK